MVECPIQDFHEPYYANFKNIGAIASMNVNVNVSIDHNENQKVLR